MAIVNGVQLPLKVNCMLGPTLIILVSDGNFFSLYIFCCTKPVHLSKKLAYLI